ncbi:MAG: D-xylose transport system permease protein [Acidimicrobiaceae bacterium]|nr:D-xylose transport system permease protein [Acidimicrobiaceae bacterium]
MATSTTDSSPAEQPSTAISDFGADVGTPTIGSAVREYIDRLKGGELGSLPAALGLVVLIGLFGVEANRFISKINLANLLTQATPIVILAMAVTFALLLGEIDLAAGATAGVCVVSMAYLLQHGVTPYVALPAALVIGLAIGLVTGVLVAKVGIPSFVVTLAFFLSWQGVVLLIAKEGGTLTISNKIIIAIANRNLPLWLGWVLLIVTVAGFAAVGLLQAASRRGQGLSAQPMGLLAMKAGGLAVVGFIAVWFLNLNRAFPGAPKRLEGVPVAVPVVIVLVVALSFLLGRTAWGRHVYAVGGNAEAARRAGINLVWIRVSCFMMVGVLAAIAGMALGSQLNSVSPQTGGGNTLLLAVGAAVIGGNSLFGGRGKVINAVIGGLTLATIDNGLGLLGKKGSINFSESGPKFIITGFVLLIAASVDALSRKRSLSTGH